MKLTITKTGKLSKCTLAKGETIVILSHDVTLISQKAFDSCRDKITKLVVGEGVVTIEADACRDMTALTELELPDTLQIIEQRAFEGCSALSEVRLPDGMKTIGWHAFSMCENLKKIHLPANLEKFPDCIGGCPNITSIELPASLKMIGNGAFSSVNMEEITLPEGVETIDSRAFFRNTQLKRVSLPSSVKCMAGYAFADCTALEEITFPQELRVADFQKKDTLRYFENCTALKKVYMTRDQAKIYLKATAAQLKKDSLPYKEDKDKFEIFRGCTALKEICFLEEDTSRWSDGTCDFKTEADGEHLLKCLKPGILEYTVPDDVTVIEDQAFESNTRLKTLTLNDKIKRLSLKQFAQCKIAVLTVPDTLTEIADDDFAAMRLLNQYGKPEWAEIKISDTHPTYGVQDGLLYRKKDGKPHTLLHNLKPVRWDALVIPQGIEVLAPFSCDDSKQSEIQLPDSLRVIGMRAFANNRNVTRLALPEGVEEIGTEAFLGCRSLVEIKIPDSVVRFGDGVVVPKKAVILCSKDSEADKYAQKNKLDVRYVGQEASDAQDGSAVPQQEALFDWGSGQEQQIVCTFLGGVEDVTLPVEIGGVAVKGYDSKLLVRGRKQIKSVIVPEGIDSIPDGFFAQCEKLERIVLPSTLKSVGRNVFSNCWSLKQIEASEEMREIDMTGFLLEGTSSSDVIIRGKWGSAMHAIAMANGCRFVEDDTDEQTQQLQQSFATTLNEDGTLKIVSFFREGAEEECAVPEKIGGRAVTEIARTFVSGFERFATIRLPKTIRNIEGRTIGNTQRLIIDPENPHFKADDAMWYSEGGKVLKGVLRSARSESELSIPEGVELITEGCFDGCGNLKRLYVPQSIRGMYMYDNTVSEGYCPIRIADLSIVGQRGSYAEHLAEQNKLTFLPDGESNQIHALREQFITHRVSEEWMKDNACEGMNSGLAVGGYRGMDRDVQIPEEIAGEPVMRIYSWVCDQTLPKTVHIPAGVRQILPSKLAQEAVYVSKENPVFYSEDGKLYDREKKMLLSCPKDSDLTTFWSQMQEIGEEVLDDIRADVFAVPEGIKVWKDRKGGVGIRKLILPRSMQELWTLRVKEVVLHDTQMLLLIYCSGCEKVTVLDEREQVRYIFTGAVLKAFESAAYGERYHIYLHQKLSEVLGNPITSDEQVVPSVMLRWYDAQFEKIKNSEDKLRFAMYRLRAPYGLAEWDQEKIAAYLRRTAKKAMQFAVDENDIEFLRALIENGIVTGKNSQPLIELLSEKNMVEWTAMLLQGTRKV